MLKELIDKFFLESHKERERTHFYITDAGKCPRQTFLKFKGYPKKELDARILRIFHQGDFTHLKIMGLLFSLGLVRSVEIDIPNKEIVHGRADLIVSFEGKPYVVELKSSSRYKFEKLNRPDTDHIQQIQLYMHYFQIPQGILLYENKDTQEIKEFSVAYDKKLVDRTLKSFALLKNQIATNSMPMIPENIEKWRCEYCEYRNECVKIEHKAKRKHPHLG